MEGNKTLVQRFRERAYIIIFESDTAAGKAFDLLLMAAILLSVLATMLVSVESIDAAYGAVLQGINYGFTFLFTVEYGLRLYCARRPLKYARSFFGVVDLLAVLPTYLTPLIPGARFLDVIRILRLLRIFRVLKMVQYVGDSDLLLNALVVSRRRIGIFLFGVLTLVVILGSLMYVVEGATHGFTSIPRAVYWAVVTLTTVGYGDIAPQTPLGQALAAFIMILGYSIIAVPTGIVTAEVTAANLRSREPRRCAGCNKGPHDADAKWCKYCGAALKGSSPFGVNG
jgi:voltage-gated potassium channel